MGLKPALPKADYDCQTTEQAKPVKAGDAKSWV
jgi:hypothetical protein